MLFRLALRELIRSWRFGLFFIFNLSLGLTGFVALQAFNAALENEIAGNAKAILAGDVSVSARRELTEEELAGVRSTLPSGSVESKNYEFYAMLSSDKGSRLVLVKAIDDKYPLYGTLSLSSGAEIQSQSAKEILTAPTAWVYPELLDQIGLSVGDEVRLGQLKLKITDTIAKDETQTFRATTIASRIYINRALLPDSGLIQYGSTFSAIHLFQIPEGTNEKELQERLFDKLSDPAVRVNTSDTAGEDSGRQLGYLTDYLGLVAIVSLFMSALGAAYLYRLFLGSRMKEIAILRTLGLQSGQAVGVYILQAAMLGFLATVPTLGFAYLVLPLLGDLIGSLTSFELHPIIGAETILICLFMAVLGSFIVSLPFLVKIFDLRAAKLFSEEKFAVAEGSKRYWTFLPSLILFYGLSVHQAHSWRIGSAFAGAMVFVIVSLFLVGYLAVRSAGLLQGLRSWFLRFSFLSLSRRAGASLAIFIALGTGALLINILPQLKNSLQAEFQVDSESKVPSLFMFDIQDEQLEGIQKLLSERDIEPLGLSPMVRARILKVNGEDYERQLSSQAFKTREEERDARFRNRGQNLSYRTELSKSETIVEGKPFSGKFDPGSDKIPELSIEKSFADRLDLQIGDVMQFDVQGVEIEGKIINLRKVKWTSFQPNFFILVQDGVLNEAPKNFIMALPAMDEAVRSQFQDEMARTFSNVSVIDVARSVDDVLATAEKMSWSLELMAALALITGYIVLFSIVRGQISMRRWELNMLKILGASWKEVAGFILVEFSFLAALAAFAGALLSVLVSYSLNFFIFESSFQFSLWQPLLSVLIITILSLLIAFLASLDIVKESALSILREDK